MFEFFFQLSVKNCFIRGSVVRYVQLPADECDTQLLQDAARKEAAQNRQRWWEKWYAQTKCFTGSFSKDIQRKGYIHLDFHNKDVCAIMHTFW